ncbi:uncharacterized protein LOC135932628 [Pelmatolapia mariae]|uniref:uncharacterized protein LOC135932628 n=1 Tax=Pelmatolapia mariae TaxID=158779 RepID=UPI003211EA39
MNYCKECGRGFTTSKDFKQYELLHSGVKKHVCDQCGSSFISAPIHSLNTAELDIKTWVTTNCMLLIILGPKIPRNMVSNQILALDGITLASNRTMLDNTLSFQSHINYITRSAYFHLRNINRLRPFLTPHAAAILVHSLITSRIDYCNSLLFGSNNRNIVLQLIQNAAARVLTGTRKREHISPVLASLHWLPVKSRIEFKILLLTYKVLNNQAPSYLNDLVVPYHPIRALCSRSAGLLVVPRVFKSRMGGRAFSFQAPLLWNQLPVWIRETDTISTFKIRLKTFLFVKAYS